MLKKNGGRLLLSVVLVAVGFGSVGVDFNATHIFNPTWPPHARYHDLLLLILLVGCGTLGLWLVWRKATQAERDLGMAVAALLPFIFEAAFFIALLVPGASPSLVEPNPFPIVLGIPLDPNVVAAAVVVVLVPVSYWLYWRSRVNQSPSGKGGKV